MIERKLCPDCGGNLGKGATKCRCGWQASLASAANAGAKCEIKADCPYPGLLVVNGKRTCVVHYEEALRPVPEREPGCDDEAAHA